MNIRIAVSLFIPLSFIIASVRVEADVFVAGELETNFISNTYLDDSREWDLMVRPLGTIEFELPAEMAAGYTGSAELYTRHTALMFHEHELYWLVNPNFGSEDQHNWLLGFQIQAQKSTATYEMVNLISPMLESSLAMEPVYWWFWELGASGEYRWYPNDISADSIDSWGRISTTVSAPSRTSITARTAFGYRYYLHPAYLSDEPYERQWKIGTRVAQGLTEYVGMWADYEYLYAFDDNNIVVQQIENVELNVVGEEFLYSGHQVLGGWKYLKPDTVELTMEVGYQNRLYAGLDVLDMEGVSTGEGRVDDRIWGRFATRFERTPSANDDLILSMDISYRYLRQLSNDAWVDTDQHWFTLRFSIER